MGATYQAGGLNLVFQEKSLPEISVSKKKKKF